MRFNAAPIFAGFSASAMIDGQGQQMCAPVQHLYSPGCAYSEWPKKALKHLQDPYINTFTKPPILQIAFPSFAACSKSKQGLKSCLGKSNAKSIKPPQPEQPGQSLFVFDQKISSTTSCHVNPKLKTFIISYDGLVRGRQVALTVEACGGPSCSTQVHGSRLADRWGGSGFQGF